MRGRGLLLILLLAGAACGRTRDEACSQCGRGECKAMAFTIRLEGAPPVRTCCPRCGLRYLSGKHPRVVGLEVRDFGTAAGIDARTAVYVDGSDVNPCTHDAPAPPADDRGCCMKEVFDRCRPSLIAFASRESADGFSRQHGGIVRTFAEVEGSPR